MCHAELVSEFHWWLLEHIRQVVIEHFDKLNDHFSKCSVATLATKLTTKIIYKFKIRLLHFSLRLLDNSIIFVVIYLLEYGKKGNFIGSKKFSY